VPPSGTWSWNSEDAYLNSDSLCPHRKGEKEPFASGLTNGEIGVMSPNSHDERLTTAEAERVLIQADLSRKRRKTLRDSLAAVLILQSYLESLKEH